MASPILLLELYHKIDAKHDITLITTEYQYGNELLVHFQMGKKLHIHLNNRLSELLTDGKSITNEQFFHKKTYYQGDAKLITRSTFDARIRRFDMSQTMIGREILEEHDYISRSNQHERVQIVIADNGKVTTATIDFRDEKQHENFRCPVWLNKLEPSVN